MLFQSAASQFPAATQFLARHRFAEQRARKNVPAAGVVFAQEVEIGGFYRVGVDAFGSSSQKITDSNGEEISDYVRAGAVHSRSRLNFRAANDDGTFGGFIRLQSDVLTKLSDDIDFDLSIFPGGQVYTLEGISLLHAFRMPYGYAWWQPIEQLKLTAGFFDDFYVNDIVDNFGAVAEDVTVHYTGYEELFLTPFAQHYDADDNDTAGLGIGIYPIPGLSINLGVPFGFGLGGVGTEDSIGSETAKLVYGNFKAQVAYELEDVVRVALAFHSVVDDWQTGGGSHKTGYTATNSSIFLAGYITAIENMGINIGLQFTLPYENDAKTTWNAPFRIGLGFNYDMDAFGIGARLGFALGSSEKIDGSDKTDGPFEFGLNILPSYDLGVCKIFLNAGIHMVALSETYKKPYKDANVDVPKDGFGFHINPYVEKTIGGGSFFVGFKLFSQAFDTWMDGSDEKARIYWSVPCGMRFAF